MKKISFILAILLGISTLAFAILMPVQGIGVGVAADQSTADTSADQNAQNNMRGSCAGTIVSSQKTQDSCTQNIGTDDNPKYMCTVNYTGSCQIFGR